MLAAAAGWLGWFSFFVLAVVLLVLEEALFLLLVSSSLAVLLFEMPPLSFALLLLLLLLRLALGGDRGKKSSMVCWPLGGEAGGRFFFAMVDGWTDGWMGLLL